MFVGFFFLHSIWFVFRRRAVTTIEADEAAASSDFLNNKKTKEKEKERKRAKDKISISALLKVIFGM